MRSRDPLDQSRAGAVDDDRRVEREGIAGTALTRPLPRQAEAATTSTSMHRSSNAASFHHGLLSHAAKVCQTESFADTGVLPNFDVAPDGERILAFVAAARSEEPQTVNHVTLMLNFSDEVHRRTTTR